LIGLNSVTDADFTDVKNLNDTTRAYLYSIAEGVHPFTKRDTKLTLEQVRSN
jgi:hypothetical protein